MRSEIHQQYEHALDSSHHGHPVLTEQVYTGRRGRPAIHIDPDFLRWAYSLRSTSSISRFLHVSRQRVRSALLEHGIAVPQADPFIRSRPGDDSESGGADDITSSSAAQTATDSLLNPDLPLPPTFPPDISVPAGPSQHTVTVSFTAPLSTLSDAELDELILCLRRHYCRAGVTMLHGMLLRLGHRIPRERIRQSLLRIDPVQRVFERIRIRRRTYSVPGPNSLWHHDGQHGKENQFSLFLFQIAIIVLGLIRWGIVIHGFIDGYSRLITGLQASNNNTGQTVLDLFLRAAAVYGIPSRLRGDHGVENILVASWMEEYSGVQRGSYIWGRCVILFI